MGFALEVDMIREAHRLGMLTCPYVFTEDDAREMAKAGADVVVVHLGLTTKGAIGAGTAVTLDDAVRIVQEVGDAARAVVRDGQGEAIVLCHGGPVAEVEDAKYVLDRTRGVLGFFGASSLERLPVEKALEDAAKGFKDIMIE